jgi:hypothetical protein
MGSKPYAAVLICGKKVIIVDVMAPLERKEAKVMVEEDYPNFELVALIPGAHSSYSFVYGEDTPEVTKSRGVDPFDMSYAHE